MPCTASPMAATSPPLKMRFWPTLRKEREDWVLTEAASKPARDLSNRSASNVSLLKYCVREAGGREGGWGSIESD